VLDARDVKAAILNSIVRPLAEGIDPGCTPHWSKNKMLEFIACERRPNGRVVYLMETWK
jgi:hypothetical protein